jgi:hypothetical protein
MVWNFAYRPAFQKDKCIFARPAVQMTIRLGIAALLFMMIQAVFFGIGAVVVLATPLKDQAMELMPLMIIGTSALALPISWWLAPRLRARYWRDHERDNWADKVLDSLS